MTASLPAPIETLLGALEHGSLAELERALTLRLQPAPTPAERRVAELGLLAELLAERGRADSADVPRVEREAYERRRLATGAGAPAADTLAKRYGGWRRACRAAYGLLPDGRHRGPGKPWHSPARGRGKVAPYSREEIRAAIRRCALELGRVPSSGDYHWWSREKRRALRARGIQLETSRHPEHRIPGIEALYRHYATGHGRFRQALRDCALSEVEIAIARTKRLLPALEVCEVADGPRTALRELASRTQAALLDSDALARIEEHGFGWLGLREAVEIARLLGGSLEWLIGRSASRGSPPAGESFDGERFRLLARERKLSERELCARLSLPAGPFRRLVRGADQPLLVELALLSSLVGAGIDELVRPSPANASTSKARGAWRVRPTCPEPTGGCHHLLPRSRAKRTRSRATAARKRMTSRSLDFTSATRSQIVVLRGDARIAARRRAWASGLTGNVRRVR